VRVYIYSMRVYHVRVYLYSVHQEHAILLQCVAVCVCAAVCGIARGTRKTHTKIAQHTTNFVVAVQGVKLHTYIMCVCMHIVCTCIIYACMYIKCAILLHSLLSYIGVLQCVMLCVAHDFVVAVERDNMHA